MNVNVRPPLVGLGALALGIVAAPTFVRGSASSFLILALVPVGVIVALLLRRHAALFALVLYGTIFAFGIGRGGAAIARPPDDVSEAIGGPSVWVLGTVASDLEVRGGGSGRQRVAFLLNAAALHDGERAERVLGRLLVSLRSQDRSVPDLWPGDEVWLRGRLEAPPGATNPGAFDYAAYLARRGIYATIRPKRAADVRPTGRVTGAWTQRVAASIRRSVQAQTKNHLPAREAALMDGLLLGIRGSLSADVDDAFSRTGTVHVLSTSGLHLAVVAGSIAFLLANLPVPRPTAGLITIVLVWLFALTAGAGPAVTRSALMLTIVLLAPLARRHPDPTGGLIVAGWVILIASPLALYDAGTQFSFATVATLLAWFPVAERALFPWEPAMPWSTRLLRGALLAVAIGVIAQAGSWPLAAYHFNLFSIIAPLANPLIVLLANALLVGGLALVTLLAPLASFPPVLWLWGLLELGLRGLRFLALAFGALPLAAVSVVTPPVAFILVYYALLLGAAPVVNRAVLRRTLFAPDPPDSLPPARRVDPPAAGSSNTGGNGAAGPGGLPLASGGRAG